MSKILSLIKQAKQREGAAKAPSEKPAKSDSANPMVITRQIASDMSRLRLQGDEFWTISLEEAVKRLCACADTEAKSDCQLVALNNQSEPEGSTPSARFVDGVRSLFYAPEFVTEIEERALIALSASAPSSRWTKLSARALQVYGGVVTPVGLTADVNLPEQLWKQTKQEQTIDPSQNDRDAQAGSVSDGGIHSLPTADIDEFDTYPYGGLLPTPSEGGWGSKALPQWMRDLCRRVATVLDYPPYVASAEVPRGPERVAITGDSHTCPGTSDMHDVPNTRYKYPNHILLNCYRPGEGIMPHTDGPAYSPQAVILSLGATTVLSFWKDYNATKQSAAGALVSIFAQRRSLLAFRDDLYLHNLHGIEELKEDTLLSSCANARSEGPIRIGQTYTRGEPDEDGILPVRLSFTLRYVRPAPATLTPSTLESKTGTELVGPNRS